MKRNRAKTLQIATALGFVALVCVGLAFHTGTGTPSAWGIYNIAAICPLGALEAMIASKTVVPPLLVGLIIAVAVTFLVGKAFCAWGCPVPLLWRIFGVKEHEGKQGRKRFPRRTKKQTVGAIIEHGGESLEDSGDSHSELNAVAPQSAAVLAKRQDNEADLLLDIPHSKRGSLHDSRNWVLGGALLSTALFGFPVFCLVCPVGLSFATLIAVWHLFQFGETTWSLLVFPAMLILEIVVLRKWCHRFCPLGALLSLVSRVNRTLRPQVNREVCRHEKGEACRSCSQACPEGIDFHDKQNSAPLNECTKCATCASKCPAQAISFPFFAKKEK